MAKQVTKDFNLNIAHIEAAVAAYLKPYFPETTEVHGVDITFPVSQRDGTVVVRAYLGAKEPKQEELPLEEPEVTEVKKVNNKRKNKE